MLAQRILTAVVLLAVFLPVLFSSLAWPFSALTLLMIGLAGWEWCRLNGVSGAWAVAGGSGLAAVGAAVLSAGWPARVPQVFWCVAGFLWLAGGLGLLRAGVAGWPRVHAAIRLVLGLAALGVSWLAMCTAREQGVAFLLSLLVLVWTADVAAYFGGRAWGRCKLALSISPGKSWEGVYAGMAAVAVLAVGCVWFERADIFGHYSFFFHVWQRGGWLLLVLVVMALALVSVMGDLLESLVKRSAGVKDSSRLLPGHGGVLDRIDALLPVFPVALAVLSFS